MLNLGRKKNKLICIYIPLVLFSLPFFLNKSLIYKPYLPEKKKLILPSRTLGAEFLCVLLAIRKH